MKKCSNYDIRQRRLDELFSYSDRKVQSSGYSSRNFCNSIFSNSNTCNQKSKAEKTMETMTTIMNGISVASVGVTLGYSIFSLVSQIKQIKNNKTLNPFNSGGQEPVVTPDTSAQADALENSVDTALKTDDWKEVKNQIKTSNTMYKTNEKTIESFDGQISKANDDIQITNNIITQAETDNSTIEDRKTQANTDKTTTIEKAKTTFEATETDLRSKITDIEVQMASSPDPNITNLNTELENLQKMLKTAEANFKQAKEDAEKDYATKIEELNKKQAENDKKIAEYPPILEVQHERLNQLKKDQASLTTNNTQLLQQITSAKLRLQEYGKN